MKQTINRLRKIAMTARKVKDEEFKRFKKEQTKQTLNKERSKEK